MRKFTEEYQVWSYLADQYEAGVRGESADFSGGICSALSTLVVWKVSMPLAVWKMSMSPALWADCTARLRRRYEPRWWNLWRKRHLPWFWSKGDPKPRADACDALFHEAFDEEEVRKRRRECGGGSTHDLD